jgi:hypothetical protein
MREVSLIQAYGGIRHIMSDLRMVIVCCLLCGLSLSCDHSSHQVSSAERIRCANDALSSHKLAVLPHGITDADCWTGGTFAKYMNVKFSASADQALDYLRREGAACYLEFVIEGNQYRILATHSLTGASELIADPELFCIAKDIGIRSEPWFKSVYDIRHGWYYHNFRNAPERYTIYYDVDTQQMYIYWTYS